MVIHRVIVFLMTRVRAGHFSNSICSKDVGGSFCYVVCKFLLEHVVWRLSGWTGLVVNSDVTLWCAVGVDTVKDHADLTWKVHSLDPEDEGTTVFQNVISSSPDDITCRKTWILRFSPLWRTEISQMLTHFTIFFRFSVPCIFYRLQVKFPNRCNQIYIFIVYVLTLHVSGPHWPIIRGVLGCLFMPAFGSCSAVVCPCVRGRYDKATVRERTDRQQHCMSQMVA
jgi:hypothetical protein